MPLLLTRSSGPTSLTNRSEDSTLPAVLEFQSPTKAIIAAPVPGAAHGTIWMIGSMFAACVVAMWLIPIDRVVTAHGKVVSRTPMMVVQPLETSIVRSVDVTEGQGVHRGDVLARLDPTFTSADVGALQAQVSSLQAEAARMRAEVEERSFQYSGVDPPMLLQAAIHTQRASERRSKLEFYHRKIDALAATAARSATDATAFRERLIVAQAVETMRKKLEVLQTASWLPANARSVKTSAMTNGVVVTGRR